MFWFAIAFGLLVAATLAVLKYGVMPRVADHQADILARLSQATGMEVAATNLRGGWAGFSPYVEMQDLVFREPATVKSPTRTAGNVALSLPQVRAGLSIPRLLIGQLRLNDLSISGPELTLIRANDGLIYFAGRALNQKSDAPDDGRFIDWLISQPGIELHRAKLRWRDDLTPGSDLVFSDVGVEIVRRFGMHTLGITATPPIALARKLDVRGKIALQRRDGRLIVDGDIYAAVDSANLTELRRHWRVPDNWQAGVGSARAWMTLNSPQATAKAQPASFVNPLQRVIADVHIVNARAQLGELSDGVAPLNIVRLAGRLEYVQLDNGFRVGSNKLEFRTKEGVVSPPADFSFSLQNTDQPNKQIGEITANGIDLKVVTSLIEYFPIGRDMRQTVARFGLRGLVNDGRFAWTGALEKPVGYAVKASLAGFSSLSNERTPGVSGFSGEVNGTDKGGQFNIDSKSLVLDAPTIFRAPIKLDSFIAKGKWTATEKEINVDLSNVAIANADLKGEFSGEYTRLRAKEGATLPKEDIPGALDIAGRFSNIRVANVARYLPNGLGRTRDYIEWATRAGEVEAADFKLKGRIYDFPYPPHGRQHLTQLHHQQANLVSMPS